MRLILAVRATLTAELKNGNVFTVGALCQGDYIGQTALTRERVAAGVVAIDEVTVLRATVASLDRLVHRKPELARDIGKAIDHQRLRATPELLADVALERDPEVSPFTSQTGRAGRFAVVLVFDYFVSGHFHDGGLPPRGRVRVRRDHD